MDCKKARQSFLYEISCWLIGLDGISGEFYLSCVRRRKSFERFSAVSELWRNELESRVLCALRMRFSAERRTFALHTNLFADLTCFRCFRCLSVHFRVRYASRWLDLNFFFSFIGGLLGKLQVQSVRIYFQMKAQKAPCRGRSRARGWKSCREGRHRRKWSHLRKASLPLPHVSEPPNEVNATVEMLH